ncbi:hypothetical protein FACS189426_16780 [Bacteroidia bacterium]|nr:hypothetical protein FACS189426_16780 [Bacteroidia bacterium]
MMSKDEGYVEFNNDEIYDLVKSVNIDKAQKLMYNSKSLTDKELEEIKELSGIEYLYSKIDFYLKDISDNYFFEYSILPATLDPQIKDKLLCFSLVKGDDTFKNGIENFYSSSIDRLYDSKKCSIYQHPDFLLDIKSPKESINISLTSELSFTEDIEEKEEREETTTKHYAKVELKGSNNTYIYNVLLNRPYLEIVETARYARKNNLVLLELHKMLHKRYNKHISKDKNTCYVSFPILGSHSSNLLDYLRVENDATPIQGIGAAFFYFELKSDCNKENLKNIFDSISFLLGNAVRLFSINYVFYLGFSLQREARMESIKSAISAIMSRNMSHNLGSHVVTNTKYQIEKLVKEKKDEQPLAMQLNGISKLLQYLQERQDFIAVIANSEKYTKAPLNFKSAVFDMLAMDGPAERHGSDGDRKTQNYILNNIVRSEGVFRKDEYNNSGTIPIEIQLVKFKDGKPLIFKSLNKDVEVKGQEFNDILLAVPYGLNGRQAFLTILENIIRNAAKHRKDDIKNNQLTISIITKEIEDKKYEIIICDDKQNYYNVIERFKNKEIKPIIGDDGNLLPLNILNKNETSIDKSNKGIKEILICLSWLTSKDGNVEYFKIEDNEDYNKNLLQIVGVDIDLYKYYPNKEDDGKEHKTLSLGYKFEVDKYLDRFDMNNHDYQTYKSEKFYNLPSAFLYTVSSENLEDAKKYLPRVVKNKNGKWEELFEELINEKFGKPLLVIEEKGCSNYNDEETEFVKRINSDGNGTLNQHKAVIEAHNGKSICFINHYEANVVNVTSPSLSEIRLPNKCLFREGISGGNYTHNIVRTTLKRADYLRIVEAALTRIAIVDERLFDKYGGNIDFTTIELIVDKFLGKVEQQPNRPYVPIMRDIISENEYEYSVNNEIVDIISKIKDNISNRQIVRELICPYLTSTKGESSVKVNSYPDYLTGKNIDIFTCNESGTLIDLRGNEVLLNKLGKIHFLSIHLSLLEKINGDDKNIKEKLEDFKNKYKLKGTKIAIHSGRGGLTNNIEDVTFIPLSGIDWALDNCKYVLSELFYGLKY